MNFDCFTLIAKVASGVSFIGRELMTLGDATFFIEFLTDWYNTDLGNPLVDISLRRCAERIISMIITMKSFCKLVYFVDNAIKII